MHPKSLKLLEDVRAAVAFIKTAASDKSEADYLGDTVLRFAVERNFEIIGEALGRLAKLDPVTTARISNCSRIIAFRNVLIHAYDHIDHRLVWRVIQADLPTLLGEIGQLMREEETDVD